VAEPTEGEDPPLPSAQEELERSVARRAEPDAAQRKRVTEAAVDRVEAKTRVAEAEARTAEARVRSAEIAADQAKDDRELRKKIANKVFVAAVVQVILADVGFAIYATTRGWSNVRPGTMNAWLGAAVVQVVAVALVIARSLFPAKSPG
jgi:hypothetical protein